jgi:hypothetical protein
MTTVMMAWNHAVCRTNAQPNVHVLHPLVNNPVLHEETTRRPLRMNWAIIVDENGIQRLIRNWRAQ